MLYSAFPREDRNIGRIVKHFCVVYGRIVCYFWPFLGRIVNIGRIVKQIHLVCGRIAIDAFCVYSRFFKQVAFWPLA